MNTLDLIESQQWYIGSWFGSHNSFWHINKEAVMSTWIMIGLFTIASLFMRSYVRKPDSLFGHLLRSFVRFFINLLNQSIPTFSFTHFSFITVAFCFVLGCNVISILPGIEKEPTADINTTLALGLISFFYTQIAAIAHRGLWTYIKGYFSPFFVMLPLNIVGKLASVISLSFRLFGNIFGGSIIADLWFGIVHSSIIVEIIGIVTGLNILFILFFNVFEGFLQAFVFAMLSLTYLSIALQGDGH